MHDYLAISNVRLESKLTDEDILHKCRTLTDVPKYSQRPNEY